MRRLFAILIAVTVSLATGFAVYRAPTSRLAALPLSVTTATGTGDTLAVVYSGDGGWAEIDRGVTAGLARGGVPSVGYDSLRYFWTRRTPHAAAGDLALVLRRYLRVWGKQKVILAGYSFGAGALPSIVAELPADLRARVRTVALVSAEREGRMEFHPASWLGMRSGDAFPLADRIAGLKGLPSVCIYGAKDLHAACGRFAPGLTRTVRLAGGHHFDGDYAQVSRAILAAAGVQPVS